MIQIIQGQRLREKTLDSATSVQTIAGKVILQEGLTTFYCDSAVINKSTNILEAYGNIHINQNDSIHTYSQTLRYIGNDRMAYLKKDVRLTDNKGTLYTQDLEYDLKTSIGKYRNGGRVVNGKTVLTSTEGVYYADTKDVYFKKNVHLVDPNYDFRSDTMLYNTQTQISSWTTPTVIKSKNGGDIYSSNGTYDLKNGQAFFGKRTIIKDSTRTYVADNSAYDEKTGIAQLEGNAIIKDSVNGYSVLGGQMYLNKNDNSFLATRKPVLIFKGEAQDSTFIAADTLFSGVDKVDKDGKRIVVRKDTLKKATVVNAQDSAVVIKDIKESPRKRRSQLTDSLANKLAESQTTLPDLNDSIAVVMKDNRTDTSLTTPLASIGDSLGKRRIMMDSLSGLGGRTDTLNVRDTSGKKAVRTILQIPLYVILLHFTMCAYSTTRFNQFAIAFITRPKIQFSGLFRDPLVFSNNSQISGDTIYLFTKNKKAERVYVFENGIVINKANEKMFNQVGGRTINGYFKDGNIDYVRAKGSPAESVYYPQDDDSAYIGMNRSKGDVIDVYFLDKAIHRVKFINDVDGTLFPLRQIPEDQKFLRNYEWLDKRRPKSKFELFE